jgi:hypothetical protein
VVLTNAACKGKEPEGKNGILHQIRPASSDQCWGLEEVSIIVARLPKTSREGLCRFLARERHDDFVLELLCDVVSPKAASSTEELHFAADSFRSCHNSKWRS